MSTKQTFKSKERILKIANEMNCNDFLLEFGQVTEIDEMENLLDANEGMVNFSIDVKEGNKIVKIYLLYIDGQFDSYSY